MFPVTQANAMETSFLSAVNMAIANSSSVKKKMLDFSRQKDHQQNKQILNIANASIKEIL